jgi:multicomponent Na+:H+ antiporter subunit G
MNLYIDIAGAIITLIGSLFLFLGALGLLRMPDLFNRIQAGTKASTLGTILTLLGIGIINFDWIGKIIVLIIFVLITNPVSSHVLARAAHFSGVHMTRRAIIDLLKPKLKVAKPEEQSEIISKEPLN